MPKANRRLAEGSAAGGELRHFLAGGVVTVDQHDQRPGRDVLDEAQQQAAEDRWPRQGRLEPRICGAEDRAVLDVERETDGSPVVAAGYELAQDLDVIVLRVEEALVERLLERHHHRRNRASDPPSQGLVEVAWRNPGHFKLRPVRTGRLQRPRIHRTERKTSIP